MLISRVSKDNQLIGGMDTFGFYCVEADFFIRLFGLGGPGCIWYQTHAPECMSAGN